MPGAMRHLPAAAVFILVLPCLAVDSEKVGRAGLTLTIGSQGHLETASADREVPPMLRRDGPVPTDDAAAVEVSSAAQGIKQEPSVSCGLTTASTCSACPQGHGSSWCSGECKWETDTGQCVFKHYVGYVPDPTDAPNTAAPGSVTAGPSGPYPDQPGHGSQTGTGIASDSNITAPTVDKKAAAIRHEQARFEAEEAQRKKDEDQFLQTVCLSAAVSAVLVTIIFLCGYFCLRELPTSNAVDNKATL